MATEEFASGAGATKEAVIQHQQGSCTGNQKLQGAPAPSEEEVQNHQDKDQAEAATTVIAHTRTHIITAPAEEEEKNNKNENKRHGRENSTGECSHSRTIPRRGKLWPDIRFRRHSPPYATECATDAPPNCRGHRRQSLR